MPRHDRHSPAPADPVDRRIHLRAAGVSVLLDMSAGRTPAITHWGADLGSITAQDAAALALATMPTVGANNPDLPTRGAILPQLADGWTGRPGILGGRENGRDFSPLLTVRAVTVGGMELPGAPPGHAAGDTSSGFVETGPGTIRIDLADDEAGLATRLEVELLPSGLVRMRAQVENLAETPYRLEGVSLTAPVPLDATEMLDFAGRWGKERSPQRHEITVGQHDRENRKGRTGADSAYVLHAGTAGFGFQRGEVWAAHVGFSGNQRHYLERQFNGHQVIGGGEILLPGEVVLAPSAATTYTTPWLYLSYGEGLDAVAHRFHRWLRSRPQHPSLTRPVTLNVWEAVYFDHDLARLKDLADRAARLGVERFVLDDGWFGSRRDDLRGLGDWWVSREVWPDGLAPLVEHVRGLGMEFGLWFEPEMINEDSETARAHPEWIMAPGPHRLPVRSRHQQVLNLTIPEAYAHVRDLMVEVLESADISYIKWDFNRDLIEAADARTGAPRTHAQTLATYRLMHELKDRFPRLEIESCASGGARVDLGVLEHTDRVWVSDNIDPLDRQQMNRWTAQLIPLELMGSHVASGASHTTGRLHSLSFRAATAIFGHLGVEWDLARASAQELDELAQWITLHQQHRELLFTGDLVRVDRGDESLQVTGVVAPDRGEALFSLVGLTRSVVSPRGQVRLPGLDPARRYRVRPVLIGDVPSGLLGPAWFGLREAADVLAYDATSPYPVPGRPSAGQEIPGITLSGAQLAAVGIAAPMLNPEQALVLQVQAVG